MHPTRIFVIAALGVLALAIPMRGVAHAATSPTITSQASFAEVAGGYLVSDSATLAGGNNPTGVMTFTVYAASDTTCAGPPLATSPATVVGNGTYASFPFFVVPQGTYRFVVTYSGDANNNPVTSPCNAPNESVTIPAAATPTITSQASYSEVAGGYLVSDSATLAGGDNPTGVMTFKVYAPDDTTCAGPPLGTSPATVAGNGTYSSFPFFVVPQGTYRFVVTYGGDAHNNSVTSPCNAPNESVTIPAAATPTITSQASFVAVPGGYLVSDSAVLAGGDNPTGVMTFKVYAPDDTTCAGPPLGTSPATVVGDGTYSSFPFFVVSQGGYRFVVNYSGDAHNNPVTTPCNAPNESVLIGPPLVPGLTTQASSTVTLFGSIHDTATLSGGFNPTGTLTFSVYGPDNGTCAGTPASTTTTTVNGDGAYTSSSFTPSATGTYRYVVTYSGDANNTPVTSPCNASNESVTVTRPVSPTNQCVGVAGSLSTNNYNPSMYNSGAPNVNEGPFSYMLNASNHSGATIGGLSLVDQRTVNAPGQYMFTKAPGYVELKNVVIYAFSATTTGQGTLYGTGTEIANGITYTNVQVRIDITGSYYVGTTLISQPATLHVQAMAGTSSTGAPAPAYDSGLIVEPNLSVIFRYC